MKMVKESLYKWWYFHGQFKDGLCMEKVKLFIKWWSLWRFVGKWERLKEKNTSKFTTDEKYYALIIGNNDYEKLEDLDNAVNDAKDLEKVLKENMGLRQLFYLIKNLTRL